ncbi:hypothetical protein MAC_06948 [Metarhizium acridum CQMa 102]|uniref:Rhodopsin domain-containing protein n=1 Tax=Metarhizium acridum (strain CQMa 102) TaxID=655827 RepID=E9EAQ0_METAQ|nr:uncharacterized protein MAC_06948 [Metarhizium acridum CQMa 102]EFY87050.1 hypothetical protein MAC_06948 [Metarhizium acridum CQMa 102]
MNSTKDLCEIPAGKPPGGKYNFIDPPSLGPTVIAVGTTLLAISTAFTVGRLFINRSKLHSADYITFVACLVNIAYTGVIIALLMKDLVSAEHNSFHHAWDVPVCFYTGQFLQLPFIQTVLFSPVFFFSKAAIFLLYRQLFATGRRLKIAINLGLAATFLVYLSNIPLAAVYAAPDPGKPWSSLLVKLQTKGQKFSLAGAVQSAVGTAIDLYIFFLPMPILLGLHLPLKRRLQLVCVFSIALLLIETDVAIIVGCMPACAQFLTPGARASTFFKSLRSRLLGSHRAGTSTGKTASSKLSASYEQQQQQQKRGQFGRGSDQSKQILDYEMSDTQPLKTTARDDDGSEWHHQSNHMSEHRPAQQWV